MKVSEIQLDMLLERYKSQANDPRRTDYGREVAAETVSAHRILGAIPIVGKVS